MHSDDLPQRSSERIYPSMHPLVGDQLLLVSPPPAPSPSDLLELELPLDFALLPRRVPPAAPLVRDLLAPVLERAPFAAPLRARPDDFVAESLALVSPAFEGEADRADAVRGLRSLAPARDAGFLFVGVESASPFRAARVLGFCVEFLVPVVPRADRPEEALARVLLDVSLFAPVPNRSPESTR